MPVCLAAAASGPEHLHVPQAGSKRLQLLLTLDRAAPQAAGSAGMSTATMAWRLHPGGVHVGGRRLFGKGSCASSRCWFSVAVDADINQRATTGQAITMVCMWRKPNAPDIHAIEFTCQACAQHVCQLATCGVLTRGCSGGRQYRQPLKSQQCPITATPTQGAS